MDLEIVVIAKKINPIIVDYLDNNYKGVKKSIVSPEVNKSHKKNSINYFPDSQFLDYDQISKKLEGYRVGWYFQQFLKYSVVLKSKYENVLIIDGDSILKESSFETNSLYTTMKEVPKAYVSFNCMIMDDSIYSKITDSFITNQMCFNKLHLINMLNVIENIHQYEWIDCIILKIDKANTSMFSEYQLYAAFVISSGLVNKTLAMKVFRRMDCVQDTVDNALLKYDLIAYEFEHPKGYLRIMRAKIYYKLGVSLG